MMTLLTNELEQSELLFNLSDNHFQHEQLLAPKDLFRLYAGIV